MRGNVLVQAEAYTKELYGYQYIIKGGTAELVWKIQDFNRNANLNLNLEYIKNSLSVTDYK